MRLTRSFLLLIVLSYGCIYGKENIKIYWKNNGSEILIFEGESNSISKKLETKKLLGLDEGIEKACETVGEFSIHEGQKVYRVINNFWISDQEPNFYRCSIMNEAKEYLLKYFVKQYRASQRKV